MTNQKGFFRNRSAVVALLFAVVITLGLPYLLWQWYPKAPGVSVTDFLTYPKGEAITDQVRTEVVTYQTFVDWAANGKLLGVSTVGPVTTYTPTGNVGSVGLLLQGYYWEQAPTGRVKVLVQTTQTRLVLGLENLFYNASRVELHSYNLVTVYGVPSDYEVRLVYSTLIALWLLCIAYCWLRYWSPALKKSR